MPTVVNLASIANSQITNAALESLTDHRSSRFAIWNLHGGKDAAELFSLSALGKDQV